MAVPRAEPLYRRNAAGRHQNPRPQRRRADCEQGRRKKQSGRITGYAGKQKKRIKPGRLKVRFQTALLSAKYQRQQLNNFYFIPLCPSIPIPPDSSKINKNNLIIRYKIKNQATRLLHSPSIYKQKLSTLEV